MFFFLSATDRRTPSAVQLWQSAEDSALIRLSFPEPYEASNLKISFSTAKTLQNSEICNEIDTTALKYQVKIHTSAFGSLTAAMEEDTNQTSQQLKMYLGAQSTLGDTGSLIWKRVEENCMKMKRSNFFYFLVLFCLFVF